MKSFWGLGFALAFAHAAVGQPAQTWRWNDLPASARPPGATVVSEDGRTALRISHASDAVRQFLLLTIDHPPVSSQVYAIKGEVRCDGLHGSAILEMWSDFPPPKLGAAPVRSSVRVHLDSGAPGSTAWRPFSIPFNRGGLAVPPERIQVNLVMDRPGTVYLGPLRLIQFVGEGEYTERDLGKVWLYGRTAHPWWSNRAAIRVGTLASVILVTLGAYTEKLGKTPLARPRFLTLLKLQMALGGLLAAAALDALWTRQPFAVWFPLSLGAIILAGVYGLIYLTTRRPTTLAQPESQGKPTL